MLGAFIWSYTRRRSHGDRGATDPDPNLDARQAMAVPRIANIVGFVATTVVVGYYVYTHWSL
jgi:hypothetical protein